MSDFADFVKMLRGIDHRTSDNGEEKGLTITPGASLDPGGFVNELRGRAITQQPSDTAGLQAVRLRNELVLACIAARSNTAQDPRLIVQKRAARGSNEYEEASDHPFRSIMMRPNPNMTEADLMRAAIVSWDISNPRRFYCERVVVNGLLKEIHPLDPSFMKPRRGRSGAIMGYVWDDGSLRKEYAPEELIIRSAPAWYDPPPLISALGSIGSDTAQTDYVQTFFANGGTPPGYLKADMPLSRAQKDDIRAQWRDRYGNALGRQFDVGVLDRDADYKEIGSKLDSLSSDILRAVAESRICMVFGVPPLIVYAYVGLMRATYSNLKEAWSSFWDATMSPLFKEWRAFWTWHLLTEFEYEQDILNGNIRLVYDLNQVAALQDDVDALHDRSRKNFASGGITLNEFRSDIGRMPDVNGDYYVWNAGRVTIPAGTAAKSLKNTKSHEMKTGRNKPSLTVVERRIEKQLQSYLADQYLRAARVVENAA